MFEKRWYHGRDVVLWICRGESRMQQTCRNGRSFSVEQIDTPYEDRSETDSLRNGGYHEKGTGKDIQSGGD